MNARWLEQLDEGDTATRRRVRARFWQELTSAEPKEGIQAALAATHTARASLRRKLKKLLLQGALENEIVFIVLLDELVQREGAAEALIREVCQEMATQLPPRTLAVRLARALEDQAANAWILPELLALVRLAVERPCVELRTVLVSLRLHAYRLPIFTLDQSLVRDIRETITLVEAATLVFADLPLPATSAPTPTNLPLPATVLEDVASEREENNLWNWLKTKFGS